MPYQSNVVGTIADLMGRQAQIESDRLQRNADAQARASEVGAQAWSGAAGNIAQAVSSGVGNILQQRQQQRAEARQRELDAQNATTAGLNQTALRNQNADYEQQQAFRKDLSDVFRTTPMSSEGNVSVYDVPTITSAMAQRGHGDRMPQTLEALNGMNTAFRQEYAAKVNVAQRGAQELLRGGADYPMVMHFIDTLEANGTFSKTQLDRVREHIDADPANNLVPTLQMYAGQQKLTDHDPTHSMVNEIGQVVVPAVAPIPKPVGTSYNTTLNGQPARMQQFSDGNPRQLPGETPYQAPNFTPEERIVNDQRVTLNYNHGGPNAGKYTDQNTGAVVPDSAKAAPLRAPRQPGEPVDVTPDVETTFGGNKYLDLSRYGMSERPAARKAANAAGVVTIDKKTDADALHEIDKARLNQQEILAQVKDLLPAGAMGRIEAYPGMKLSQLFQTNDQVAAFNTWRSAAIQALRATAGSAGFRINEAEIALAIKNDLPLLTDTIGAAQQKNANVNSMLNNAESPLIVRDRSRLNTTTNPAAAPTSAMPPAPPGWKYVPKPGGGFTPVPDAAAPVPPPGPRSPVLTVPGPTAPYSPALPGASSRGNRG